MTYRLTSTYIFLLYLMCSSMLYAGQYSGKTKEKLENKVSFSLKASQSQYIREHQFELVDAIRAGDCDSVTKHYYRIMDAGQIDAAELMSWYEAQIPQNRRKRYGKHIVDILLAPDSLINARYFLKSNQRLISLIKLPKQTKEEGKESRLRVQKAVDDAQKKMKGLGKSFWIPSDAIEHLSKENPNIEDESSIMEQIKDFLGALR